MNKIDILIVGVGGQGVILASEILSDVGLKAGYDVKKSEIHGMSQRGGSVSSDIRFNKNKVFSPIIPAATADFILGFEKLETFRALPSINEKGIIISSDFRLDPMTVSTGAAQYPAAIEETIKKTHGKTYFFNEEGIVKKIGNPKAINIYILGALASFLEIEKDLWTDVIKSRVPPATVALNIAAFNEGMDIAR